MRIITTIQGKILVKSHSERRAKNFRNQKYEALCELEKGRDGRPQTGEKSMPIKASD